MKETYNKALAKNGPDGNAAPLVFHTFYAEYRGATAEDIIAALHRDSKSGTGMDYRQWWDWQAKLWQRQSSLPVPAPDDPNACARLLDILLDVGALEHGPRPADAPGRVPP